MKITRMIIDILMTLLLPLLMAYSLIGENTHEVLGICMFVLFIAHHVINRKWWTGNKGKYNAVRILNTAVNLFLVVFMICFSLALAPDIINVRLAGERRKKCQLLRRNVYDIA